MIQTDPQYKLRWSEYLRDKVKDSAEKHKRSMNADIIARLEDSFMREDADEHINDIRQDFPDIRVLDLGEGVKRVVYGKMLKVFDIDYMSDMDKIQHELNEILKAIMLSEDLRKRFNVCGKHLVARKGGHHIDIVEEGVGSLNWIKVENLPTTIESLSRY